MVKEFVKGKKYRTTLGYIIEFVELDKIGDPMFKPLGGHPYKTNKLGLIEFSKFTAIKFQQLPDEVCEKVIKVYINASMSQLSIARHSGGAIVNGKKYIWDYANDSLVLKSYKKEWAKIAEKKPLWR